MNILERLSKLEHIQWREAIKKVLTNTRVPSATNRITIYFDKLDINRWEEQSSLKYENLLPIDKEKDRVFARKVMEEMIHSGMVSFTDHSFTIRFLNEDAYAWHEIQERLELED